jgi:hypothetical protein
MADAAVIHQAYRFALDPSIEQEQFLAGCAGASRFWFNQGLALVKQRLDERSQGADVDVPWSYKSRSPHCTSAWRTYAVNKPTSSP